MEPIFENVTVPTQEHIATARWVVQGKGRINNLLVWGGIAALVCLTNLAMGSFDHYTVVYLAVVAVLSVLQLTVPIRGAKSAYLRILSYYDNTLPPTTVRFYENYFEVRQVDSLETTPYRKLTAAKYRKGVLVLIRKDGLAYYLDTNAFTKGDYDSFTHFLREKAPHLEAITGK